MLIFLFFFISKIITLYLKFLFQKKLFSILEFQMSLFFNLFLILNIPFSEFSFVDSKLIKLYLFLKALQSVSGISFLLISAKLIDT